MKKPLLVELRRCGEVSGNEPAWAKWNLNFDALRTIEHRLFGLSADALRDLTHRCSFQRRIIDSIPTCSIWRHGDGGNVVLEIGLDVITWMAGMNDEVP